MVFYLDSVMSPAQQNLPVDAMFRVGTGALEHISNIIESTFLSDNVRGFNDPIRC